MVLVYFGNRDFLLSQWQGHPKVDLDLILASTVTLWFTFFKKRLVVSDNDLLQRYIPCSSYETLCKTGRYPVLKKGGVPHEPRK